MNGTAHNNMTGIHDRTERPVDFTSIVRRYTNRVYNQAYRMLGNSEDAEEAVQDIFLKIYHSLGDFRGDSKLTTWIYRITANECISRLRKKQLDTTSMDEPVGEDGASVGDFIPSGADTPDEVLAAGETRRMIRDKVRELPAHWAMAISMYHFDDLSYDEIADVMEIPSATVATYIFRGRKRLASMLAGLTA